MPSEGGPVGWDSGGGIETSTSERRNASELSELIRFAQRGGLFACTAGGATSALFLLPVAFSARSCTLEEVLPAGVLAIGCTLMGLALSNELYWQNRRIRRRLQRLLAAAPAMVCGGVVGIFIAPKSSFAGILGMIVGFALKMRSDFLFAGLSRALSFCRGALSFCRGTLQLVRALQHSERERDGAPPAPRPQLRPKGRRGKQTAEEDAERRQAMEAARAVRLAERVKREAEQAVQDAREKKQAEEEGRREARRLARRGVLVGPPSKGRSQGGPAKKEEEAIGEAPTWDGRKEGRRTQSGRRKELLRKELQAEAAAKEEAERAAQRAALKAAQKEARREAWRAAHRAAEEIEKAATQLASEATSSALLQPSNAEAASHEGAVPTNACAATAAVAAPTAMETPMTLPTATAPAAPSEESPRPEAAADGVECAVCLERPRGVLFFPCGHVITCIECAQKVQDCPTCRQSISQKIRAFL
uniref:RING-type domain-containing protein n=1 Tax=Coccolithus braarudii TaxID=221442 RepID=A0A7S0PZ46_9EUKA